MPQATNLHFAKQLLNTLNGTKGQVQIRILTFSRVSVRSRSIFELQSFEAEISTIGFVPC